MLAAALPVSAAETDYRNTMEVTTGGDFYAGDYTFMFTVGEGQLSATDTTDVLGVYWGDLSKGAPASNAYTLNYTENGITLTTGRGTVSNLTNNTITEDTSYSYYESDKYEFTTKLEVGKTYVVHSVGGDQSQQVSLYGADGTLLESGTAYKGNMNGGDAGTTMNKTLNAAYQVTSGATSITWNGVEDANTWGGDTWLNGETATGYAPGIDLVFGSNAANKTVQTNGYYFADAISVQDNYTFTNTGTTVIDATGITIAADKKLTLATGDGATGTATLHTTVSGANMEVTGTWNANKNLTLNSISFGENGRLNLNKNVTLDLTAFTFDNGEKSDKKLYETVKTLNSHVDTADGSFIKLAPPSGNTEADENNRELRLAGNALTLNQNFHFTTNLEVNGGLSGNPKLSIAAGATLQLSGGVQVSSHADLNVNGGNLIASGITLGHRAEGNDNSYYGKLTMSSGSIKTGSIYFRNQKGNDIDITGGTLEFTTANALTYNTSNTSDNRVSVNISNTTLKATTVAWTLNGNTTAQSSVSNLTIADTNTQKITLNNVTVSGSIANNHLLELGSGTTATTDVTLTGDGETTVYGNYSHLKAEGTGTLNIKSDSTVETLTAKTGIVNIEGTHNNMSMIDASVGGNASATVNLKSGAEVTATTLKGSSNSSIEIREEAVLRTGSLIIKKAQNESVETAKLYYKFDQWGQQQNSYILTEETSQFTVENAEVTIEKSEDADLYLNMQNSKIINNGTGTISLPNGYNKLSDVEARKGNINLQWGEGQHQLNTLYINDSLAVGAHINGDILTDLANLGTITVTQAITVGADTSVYSNLVINSGASLTMDGAMNLYGTLTLNTGLELDGELLTQIKGLTKGDSLAIFNHVSDLVLGEVTETAVMTLDTESIPGVDASPYFTNLDEGLYYITFENNTVSIYSNVPEPTTATLSLLALAALAARRRRASR